MLKADRRPRYMPHQEISTQIILILKSHPGMMTIAWLSSLAELGQGGQADPDYPFEAYM